MSLLREAMRSRAGKEKDQSKAEPLSFKGPIIDADEILGSDHSLFSDKQPAPSSIDVQLAGEQGSAEKGSSEKVTSEKGASEIGSVAKSSSATGFAAEGTDEQNTDAQNTDAISPSLESTSEKSNVDKSVIDDSAVEERLVEKRSVKKAYDDRNSLGMNDTGKGSIDVELIDLAAVPMVMADEKFAGAEPFQQDVGLSDAMPATTETEQSVGGNNEAIVNQAEHASPSVTRVSRSAAIASRSTYVIPDTTEPGEQALAKDRSENAAISRQSGRQIDSPANGQLRSDQTDSATSPKTFGSINLDPLFFIIIAAATVGLFASLYALVTQNNAFVSSQYTELRERQSELEEFASQQQPGRMTDAAVGKSSESGVLLSAEYEIESQTVPSPGQSGVVDDSLDSAPSAVNTEESVRSAVDVTLPSALSPPQGLQPTDQSGELVALQLELGELRQSLADQNSKIAELVTRGTSRQQAATNVNESVSSLNAIPKPMPGSTVPENASAKSVGISSGDEKADSTGVSEADLDSEKGTSESPVDNGALNDTMGLQRTTRDSVVPAASAQGDSIGYDSTGFATIVGQAFHAYSTGNLELAESLYDRALQLEPYNRDANLGVAAVAMNTGAYGVAIQRYRHLLSLNPTDVVAYSAMLNLVAATRNGAVEHEMIVHSLQHRNTPGLHAALGNYYSQVGRWADASNSYASAVGLAPETADYLYNLAVSLDNLGRSSAAIENYQRALTLSEFGSFTFNAAAAHARLQALQGE